MDKGFIELEKNKVGVICNRFSDLLQNNTDSYFDSFNYTKEIIEKRRVITSIVFFMGLYLYRRYKK